jgi:formate hydrogenlyase subunit 3/multisubunit Na+/H+ antiporter MnhD subunit
MELQHIIGYIILFSPLILAFLCLLANLKKNNSVFFYINNIIILTCAAALILLLPNFQTNIISNISSEIISVGINYDIGILSLFFIILITSIQLLTTIFYQKNLQNYFNGESERLFYALNLVNLFAIIGIFTSSNIINLYFLIEIYSLTFYSLKCISKNKPLNNLAFKYFYQGAIGSILLLISFLFLFINFDSANFEIIFFTIQNIGDSNQKILVLLIFFIAIFGLLLKFFPFWLHHQNLKNRDSLSHFFLSNSLFIQSLIGFYLLIKFFFLLFDSELILQLFGINLPFFALAFLLIFYSNFKIFKSRNLKTILFYFCLNYIGFFLISLAVNDENSLIAAIFFIAHYCLSGLILLFICGVMTENFKSCNIENLSLLKEIFFPSKYIFPFLILLFCAATPTILFLANWHLIYAIFDYKYLSLILFPILTTSFVFYNLSIKMLSAFYFKTDSKLPNNLQDNIHHLISFSLIILAVILLISNPKIVFDIFRNLSFYLK